MCVCLSLVARGRKSKSWRTDVLKSRGNVVKHCEKHWKLPVWMNKVEESQGIVRLYFNRDWGLWTSQKDHVKYQTDTLYEYIVTRYSHRHWGYGYLSTDREVFQCHQPNVNLHHSQDREQKIWLTEGIGQTMSVAKVSVLWTVPARRYPYTIPRKEKNSKNREKEKERKRKTKARLVWLEDSNTKLTVSFDIENSWFPLLFLSLVARVEVFASACKRDMLTRTQRLVCSDSIVAPCLFDTAIPEMLPLCCNRMRTCSHACFWPRTHFAFSAARIGGVHLRGNSILEIFCRPFAMPR